MHAETNIEPRCPAPDEWEHERLAELDWRYADVVEHEVGRISALRVGEVCAAATIALALAYCPIEFGYNQHVLQGYLAYDHEDVLDSLGVHLAGELDEQINELSLDQLRLVDRLFAAYEALMVDGKVVHATLDAPKDQRRSEEVRRSLSLRDARIMREIERQLRIRGSVTDAERALLFVARLHATPTNLLREMATGQARWELLPRPW